MARRALSQVEVNFEVEVISNTESAMKAPASPQHIKLKEAVTERRVFAESMERPPSSEIRTKSPGLSMRMQLESKNANQNVTRSGPN
jgi:hypothetical protein